MSQFTVIKKSASNQKAFCKVCKDAGKPESVYTSHWVRETPDIRSKVVCPTLLALECRYCHANNHTVKYCPVLKKQAQDQEQSKPKTHTKMPTIGKPVRSNIFMCLDSDSEEDEVKVKKEEQFPALSLSAPAPVWGVKNYATAVSQTVQLAPVVKALEDTRPLPEQISTSPPEYKSVPWATSVQQIAMTSWADDCSSDEDEDEN